MYTTISTDPADYKWYFEDIKEDQSLIILREQGTYDNCFLVRTSGKKTFLSYKQSGAIKHSVIEKTLKGFDVGNKNIYFKSIPDLVTHYQKSPIFSTQLLGVPCDNSRSGNKPCTYAVKCIVKGQGQRRLEPVM